MILDCRISGCGPCFYHIGPQHLGLSTASLCASCWGWFYSFVHGDGRYPVDVAVAILGANSNDRSCGSSTSDPALRPRTADSSIRLPSTKSNQIRTKTTNGTRRTRTTVLKRPPARCPRCIPLPNLTGLRLRHPCLGILVVLLVQRTPMRPVLVPRLPTFNQVISRVKSPNRANTHTTPRRSIRTMRTQKTPTRSVLPSKRSWKCLMSAADGGKPERQPGKPELRRPTI